jgi:cell wall-associated NlpC family hydrolase
MLGDILTFKRNGGGHVGIYAGEDATHYHVLGGNQNNSVSVTRIAKSRLHQARRTAWKVAQPANVRKVFLEAKGTITTNEQ